MQGSKKLKLQIPTRLRIIFFPRKCNKHGFEGDIVGAVATLLFT